MATNDDSRDVDDVTLARARAGDRAAFRALVERYERPVFALLGRMLVRSGREALTSGATLDWAAITRIETKALVKGGMAPETAGATVKRAIDALQKSGVTAPVRRPWGK